MLLISLLSLYKWTCRWLCQWCLVMFKEKKKRNSHQCQSEAIMREHGIEGPRSQDISLCVMDEGWWDPLQPPPPPPPPPSLISLMVSVDIKHHVYLLILPFSFLASMFIQLHCFQFSLTWSMRCVMNCEADFQLQIDQFWNLCFALLCWWLACLTALQFL